jgi:hypothetical protein
MESKGKKVLKFRYRDSGVITLRNAGNVMFVAAGLCLLIGELMPAKYYFEVLRFYAKYL